MSDYGYAGEILRVDLSDGKISVLQTVDYTNRFLGGLIAWTPFFLISA